ERGAGRRRYIRRIAARQPLDEVAVGRPEAEPVLPGEGCGLARVVQYPAQLGCREVGIERKAAELEDLLRAPLALERRYRFRRALILPDDGVRDRPAGPAITSDDRLALIGERDARGSPLHA